MSFTHKITQGWEGGGRSISQQNNYTGSGEASIDESVPDSSTDLQINVAIDFSALQALYLVSDQDVTVETNNGTTPDDTINLLANKPLVWHAGSYHANPLTVDVTAIFVTNSSGAAAQIQLEALQDATP